MTVLVAQDDGEYTAYCSELGVATAMGTPEAVVKDLPDGTVLRVAVRHQRGKDIPQWLFSLMLKQECIY